MLKIAAAAFGMLENQRWFFIILTVAVVLAGIYYILSGKLKSNYLLVCFMLIISGGIGNLIDRIFRGYVIDYIEVLFVHFAVFNFADILVTCGSRFINRMAFGYRNQRQQSGKNERKIPFNGGCRAPWMKN